MARTLVVAAGGIVLRQERTPRIAVVRLRVVPGHDPSDEMARRCCAPA